jgi:DNA polymerase-3 subunit delta
MKEVNEILKQIKDGITKQVYVFDGEEAYFVDLLVDAFEHRILQEHEKDFNFRVFFGKDAVWNDIVNECRSFPVFASKRLVMLKEASQLKDLELLEAYLKNPADTTIFIIAHKYKKIDGRSALAKYIKSKEAKSKIDYITFDKLKDHQIADWILQYCARNQIKINAVNADLLAAYLGTDLQKIVNELEKVCINIKEGEEITEELIEKYIGISKDYNVFQFPKAIIERKADMVFKIVHYYMANPKEGPMVVITAMLYGEFCKLYKYHYAKNLPQAEMAKAIGIAPFFVKDYQKAAQHFNLTQTIKAIEIIHQYNLHAIGIDIASNDISMLKELSFKLLYL